MRVRILLVLSVVCALALPAGTLARSVRTAKLLVTAYCLQGKTASGKYVHRGAVAVDRHQFTLGRTQFTIPGYGWGIARDTGGAIGWGHIDVWMSSCAAAKRWGARTLHVSYY